MNNDELSEILLIYFRSTGRVPDFFVSTADALNDIRKCAGGAA